MGSDNVVLSVGKVGGGDDWLISQIWDNGADGEEFQTETSLSSGTTSVSQTPATKD
jgi:hypothetical protein